MITYRACIQKTKRKNQGKQSVMEAKSQHRPDILHLGDEKPVTIIVLAYTEHPGQDMVGDDGHEQAGFLVENT